MRRFDFKAVHDAMEFMQWEWITRQGRKVPSVEQIKERTLELLNSVGENDVARAGGFCVYSTNGLLSLSFEVEWQLGHWRSIGRGKMTDRLDRILVGNALDVLPALKPNSIHCSVASPPYYSLRQYAGEQQCEWPAVEYSPMPGLPTLAIEPTTCALGHEPTIETYIGHLVAIYREVWRVLREDGVVWIVMGDSYAANRSYQVPDSKWQDVGNDGGSKVQNGLKSGDLILIPHRLALALQADGWLVRNDCVWAKKSPMPESVGGWRWERCRIKERRLSWNEYTFCPGCPKCAPNDGYVLKRHSWRHTRAHEFILMCTKKMGYWANQEAAREAQTAEQREKDRRRIELSWRQGQQHKKSSISHRFAQGLAPREPNPAGRNPRSVLSPKQENFSGKHFAAYPSTLIEPLVRATCPARCCPECKAGWAVVVEKKRVPASKLGWHSEGSQNPARGQRITETLMLGRDRDHWNDMAYGYESHILGHRPTCACGHDDHIPGIVLDPFLGSGTTGIAATALGLNFIGIELSEEYAAMARKRIEGTQPALFTTAVERIKVGT